MASVDVVIPNYNYGRYLQACVESVFADGLDDVRVTIIDNASSDNSIEVARRLADGDSRIRVVEHAENCGSHASFNEGIDLADRDYLMILCADDLLLPGALSEGIGALEATKEATFAIGIHAHNDESTVPHRKGWQVVKGESFVDSCCRTLGHRLTAQVIVRTWAQKRIGNYRTCLKYMDDLEIVLRLATTGHAVQLRAPLVFSRCHDAHMSKDFWDDRLRDLEERVSVFDSFFAREGATMSDAARRHRQVHRYIAETSYWSAASHFVRGRPREALKLFRFGLLLCPAAMIAPPLWHFRRTEGAFDRVRAALAEAFRGRPAASKSR